PQQPRPRLAARTPWGGDMARILLIDDNPLTLADMAAALESVGHKALLGGLGRRALHDAATLDYDCLVTDTVLKGASGWYLMRCARRANPTAAIIATDSAAPRGNGADLDWIAAFNAMNG